jgi:hypothetical protein
VARFIGILQKNADSLDYAYLDHWAREIKVHDLYIQVLKDAGMS